MSLIPPMTSSLREDDVSQLPALHLLHNLGFTYLTPAQALKLRGGRKANVILETVLRDQLARISHIEKGGQRHEWSQSNLNEAVRSLQAVPFGGLQNTNAQITEMLLLGKSLPQTIDGDNKSHTLRYIDWNPLTWQQNNVFHVTEEFEVERTDSTELRRPDLVLFVNGIPLCVIECKSALSGVEQGVSQQLRNQRDDEIPALFTFAQLLVSIAQNAALYATVGTKKEYWAVWKEEDDRELQVLAATPLPAGVKSALLERRGQSARTQFEALESGRLVTEQDRALYALCRPARLLELIHEYTLFDAGEKKIARYQQYFVTKNTLERIQKRANTDQRRGGVVWHTQGSGKSISMVLMAKGIARLELTDSKIVLVNDRIELDGQILNTFRSCDLEIIKAPSGAELPNVLTSSRNQVITTTLQKFKKAASEGFRLLNPNVFVLVDESHRSQFGELHARMKQALPHACYLGFTGTPIKKGAKDTGEQFGGLIQPVYPIRQAVEDGAVLRLLYEGREVAQNVDKTQLDRWFEIKTRDLSPQQRADLKRKYSGADPLNKAEKRVMEIAFDISEHYDSTWKGSGLKAQLVAPDKATALLYKKWLDDIGQVSSEVIISAPDTREGNEDVDESELPVVQAFWKRMMARFGNEKAYNDEIVAKFKGPDEPEILIVVDKLITGFDAPRNTVMYLTRILQGHTLLQAIARVNRLYEGKDFGYILDYRGVLGGLNKAMSFYDQLAEYDPDDVAETVTDFSQEIAQLDSRHSVVWDIFAGVNSQDSEAMQQHLGDQARRDDFYERLSLFSRTFKLALSSPKWLEKTAVPNQERFRRDLKFWMQLRQTVAQRYAEKVDFKAYEAQIQKLLDQHVGASPAAVVTEKVDIFNREAFQKEVSAIDGDTAASKADQIAYRLKKTVTEKIDDDPAFFDPFSKLIEETIRAFRERRLSENEYLAKITGIGEQVSDRSRANFPASLAHEPVAQAFYGFFRIALEALLEAVNRAADNPNAEGLNVQGLNVQHLNAEGLNVQNLNDIAADFALETDHLIAERMIVDWQNNSDLQKNMATELEDRWLNRAQAVGFELSYAEIDALWERVLEVAKRRYSR